MTEDPIRKALEARADEHEAALARHRADGDGDRATAIVARTSGKSSSRRAVVLVAAGVVLVAAVAAAVAGSRGDDERVATGSDARALDGDGVADACLERAQALASSGMDFFVFLQPDADPAEWQRTTDALANRTDVETFRFLDQQATFEEFKDLYASRPQIVESVTPDILPPRVEIRLVDGAPMGPVAASISGPAVREVTSVEDMARTAEQACRTSDAELLDPEPALETTTPPTATLAPPLTALPGSTEPGACATQMIAVATGDTWTLERGLGDGRPSHYDVSVDSEVVFGGCGSDQGAKAAGHMPWFSGRVGNDWLLFGEVPAGVSAVAVNGDVIDAVIHEGADLALVVATLSGSDLNLSEVTLEAVRADGTRTPLAPAAIDPGSYKGFVVVFPID